MQVTDWVCVVGLMKHSSCDKDFVSIESTPGRWKWVSLLGWLGFRVVRKLSVDRTQRIHLPTELAQHREKRWYGRVVRACVIFTEADDVP